MIAAFKRAALANAHALDTESRVRLVHHDGARLFVVAPHGMPMADIRRALAGQQPLDPPPPVKPALPRAVNTGSPIHFPRGIGAAICDLRNGALPRAVRRKHGLPQRLVTQLARRVRWQALMQDDAGFVQLDDALRAARGIAIGVGIGVLLWIPIINGLAHLARAWQ